MSIKVIPDYLGTEQVGISIDGILIDVTKKYQLKVWDIVEKTLEFDTAGGFKPVDIMTIQEYLKTPSFELVLKIKGQRNNIEKISHIPLPVTRDLAIALVSRNGGFLRLPGVIDFASNPLIARLAFSTTGESILPLLPENTRQEYMRVSTKPKFDVGGRGRLTAPKYKKNPDYVGIPLSKQEKKQIQEILNKIGTINNSTTHSDHTQESDKKTGKQINIFSVIQNGSENHSSATLGVSYSKTEVLNKPDFTTSSTIILPWDPRFIHP